MIIKQVGTKDVLPTDSAKWQKIEEVARSVSKLFCAKEIRTPTFEATELFSRGVGDATDIVTKEMYTFKDKGDRSITLKPEGTAGIVRAYIESLQSEPFPLKLFYFTPAFRYEKPQAGRLREHHQFGIEFLGSAEPSMDAEVINLAFMFLNKLGVVSGLNCHINSMGCKSCKPLFLNALTEYYSNKLDKMCEDCKVRFNKNPLRMLDCKEDRCKVIAKSAPKMLDFLCDDCKTKFYKVIEILKEMNINVVIDSTLIRGQDYYTNAVFEIKDATGSTIIGGGRYDGLVESLGGQHVPAVGFGIGIERLIMFLENNGINFLEKDEPLYFVAFASNDESTLCHKIVMALRKSGKRAETDFCGRSLKAMLKHANRLDAKYVIVIGNEEVNSKQVKIKDFESGVERVVALDELEKGLI